jgi:hypothetical protein
LEALVKIMRVDVDRLEDRLEEMLPPVEVGMNLE